MLSVGVLGAGSERYYLRSAFDAIDEYYVRGEERGYWVGKGAESLGLSGDVAAEDLHAVLEGRSPFDGASMLAGSASKGRSRPGFDLTFSAPKGVSLLGLLGEPATAKEAIAAHSSAVNQALGYLERDATFVRRGHAGVRKEVGHGLIGAGFIHVTSRLGDPQLHTHVLVANLVQGADGNWSAPDGRSLYHHGRTAGFLYQAALRAELTERLGLEWGPIRRGLAEPAGFKPEVLRHFSRRRAEIEAAMGDAGSTSAQAAQLAVFQTRAPKDHSVERSVLVASWHLRAESLGVDRQYLRSLTGPGHEPEVGPMRALSAELLGPDGLTLHASTFGRQEVLRGLAEAVPEGASVSAIEAMAAHVVSDERAVELRADGRERRWSTTELMETERALISSAITARSAARAVPGKANIALALAERPGLADEQIAAVQRLTGGGEGLSVLVGPAGTGKTFVLDAARAAWEAGGHKVVGTALAGRTAAALAEAAGVPSFTLARLFVDAERAERVLPADGVLLVDEAAMVGTRSLSRLWALAQRDGAKLVLVGDHHQVPEIEAGGAFKALATALDAPELRTNRRQGEAWEREALAELRSGHPARAVEAYVDHGRVVSAKTAPEARLAMVSDWAAARATGNDAVMFALPRSDVEALNRLARALAKEGGRLAGPELDIGGRAYAVGDDVVALRPDRRLGLLNGTRATVTGLNLGGRSVSVLTQSGTALEIPGPYLEEGHLGWGYATTLHKGQGSTVDRAFVLGGDGLYREAGYTGLSRGRASNDIYLVEGGSFEVDSHAPEISRRDAVADLSASLSRSRAHELATEASSEAGMGHGPGRSLSERPGSELAEAEPVAAHSAEREALASMLGTEPQDRALLRRWEQARTAVERHLARREAKVQSRSADEGRWLALERREVERAIEMASPARASERSIGEDIGL